FYIYSVMMSRLSDILRDIEEEESAPKASGAPQGPVVTMAVEPGPSGPLATSASRQATPPPASRPRAFAGKRRAAPGGRRGLGVPVMGRITELKPGDATSATADLDSMWRVEAEPLLGKRVLVAVRNAQDPVKGIMSQVTQDGVILDQNGTKVGISYTRVSAI